MARLRHLSDATDHLLPCRTLVGRGPEAFLRLSSPRASAPHARIDWTGGSWEVRDLASTNGTWHDGRPLEASAPLVLSVGARLAFGDPEDVWELADASAPPAMAWDPATRTLAVARDGLLAIPGEDDPVWVAFQVAEGRWLVEESGRDARPAAVGEAVHAAGASWLLYLPEHVERTAGSSALALDALLLRFCVDRTGRLSGVDLVHPRRTSRLRATRPTELLLVLARARLSDPDSEGWVEGSDLMDALRTDKAGLDLLVFRAREQFARARVADAGNIIQVSDGRRRLNVGRVEIGPA